MSAGIPWDPVWGPRRVPAPQRVRRAVKRLLARAFALGKSPVDASRGVAILAYHGTDARPGDAWWLDFHGQMSLLADLGYDVVSLTDAARIVRGERDQERPTVALAFDDGFANNLEVAYPELARRGWPATVFVTTSWVGRRPFMHPSELSELGSIGVEIGNHTHGHTEVTSVSPEELLRDVEECSDRLLDITGYRPRHFCYPNGRYSRLARDLIGRAGLETACSGRVGFNKPGQDLLVLRRLTVERGDSARDLEVRLAGGYSFLDVRQRHMDR